MKYKIYKLLHPVTKEIRYIGMTKVSLKNRLSAHCKAAYKTYLSDYDCYRNTWLRSIIDNYGIPPIIELLEDNLSLEEANVREKYYISLYGRKIFGEGRLVNTSEGGGSFEKKQISNWREITGTKVDQYSIDGILIKRWNSMTDVEEELHIETSHTSQACKGKRSTAGGYVWRYREEPFNKYEVVDTRKRRVCMYNLQGELLKTYSKAVHVIKDFPELKSTSNITSVCRGNQHTFGGFVFRYEGDSFNKFPIKNGSFKKLYIYNLDNVFIEEFVDPDAAAKKYNSTKRYLQECARDDKIFLKKFRIRYSPILTEM